MNIYLIKVDKTWKIAKTKKGKAIKIFKTKKEAMSFIKESKAYEKIITINDADQKTSPKKKEVKKTKTTKTSIEEISKEYKKLKSKVKKKGSILKLNDDILVTPNAPMRNSEFISSQIDNKKLIKLRSIDPKASLLFAFLIVMVGIMIWPVIGLIF